MSPDASPETLPDTPLVPQPTLEDFPDFVSIPIRIAHHAKGEATTKAISTSKRNSRDNSPNNVPTFAPSTFRIPNSFVRCSAVNIASPSKPRQEMNIAKNAKQFDRLCTMDSLLYNF